jgi:hypothetical protein
LGLLGRFFLLLLDQGLQVLDLHFWVHIERAHLSGLLERLQCLLVAPLLEGGFRTMHHPLKSAVGSCFAGFLLGDPRPFLGGKFSEILRQALAVPLCGNGPGGRRKQQHQCQANKSGRRGVHGRMVLYKDGACP